MATVLKIGKFPFCVPIKNPIDIPNLQWAAEILKCDEKTALAFFWRIKKIKLEVTATFSYGAFDENGDTYPYTSTKTSNFFYYTLEVENEKDLICKSFSWIAESEDPNNEIFGEITSVDFFSPRWEDKDKKIYYVGIPFGVIVRDDPDAPLGRIGVSLLFGFPPPNSDYWPQPNNLSFEEDVFINLGNNFTFETNVIKNFENVLWNSSIDFWEITVDEYWEYDPNDGNGPIYNSETGERLRSF